jgi:hypothetical protein
MVARLISSLVTNADNELLCRFPLSSEVKSAVFFYLNGDSVRGMDGFCGHFC